MKFLKKYRKKIILGIAIALILFLGFRQIQAQKYKNPQVFNPKKDTVVTPKTKDINYSITLSGSIDAKDKAEVRFQTPGRLIWVGVKEGDRVKKWQSLASLDRQELRKQLEISLNNYKTQLSQFDDTQDKYKTEKDNLTLTDEMKRILNRSQYSLNNSVISYELNDLAIKYATIWSPINGIVTGAEPANPGVNITPASSAFTIIDPNSVYFKSEIDEDDVTRVKVGQSASLKIDAYPQETFDSEITNIAFTPVPGQTSTVYKIDFKLHVDNQDMRYRLGMDGDATIILDEETNALVLPLEAINYEDDKTYVWVKKDQTLEKIYIDTGIETDTEVQILSGISINDSIVVKKI